MWDRDHAAQAAGVEIVEPGPGRSVARLTVRPDMVNGHDIAHGGYVFLLADTAFAYACNGYGPIVVARSCHIEFLAPARSGDVLEAEATERTRAGRNGIYDVAVRRPADDTLVAEFRGHSRELGEGFAFAGQT
jgi:acyl-CoA thioesterase